MQQFISKIIFQIISGDGKHTPQFDEQLVFVTGDNRQLALDKANSIGFQKQDRYLNDDEETVQWKFIGVTELQEIQKIENGVELYSSIREVDDEKNYLSLIRFKELTMQSAVDKLNEAFL